MAYAVMKLHKNIIPYYDKDDYLQEAYLALYRVLKRLAVKPDIIDSFSAYLWTAIKNTYCGLFRDYVLHHLVEIRSYESRENGLTYSQMVYFQEYAESYYSKKRESSKQYYWKNREAILKKQAMETMIYIVQPAVSKETTMNEPFGKVLSAAAFYIRHTGRAKELKIIGTK